MHQLCYLMLFYCYANFGPTRIVTLGQRAPSCTIWCTIGPYLVWHIMIDRITWIHGMQTLPKLPLKVLLV